MVIATTRAGRLRRPKRDMMLVALAGPAANLFLATLAVNSLSLVSFISGPAQQWVFENLHNAIILNLVLAVFNMLPVPPLDGAKVLVGLLPHPLDFKFARLERYGFLILIGLLFILPMLASELGSEINPVAWIVWPITEMLYNFLFSIGS